MGAPEDHGAFTRAAGLERQAEQLAADIRVAGFAIAPDVLGSAEVAALNDALDAIYARQCEQAGGEAALRLIDDLDVARCPLAYDDRFLRLAAHPLILAVARALLGPNVVLLMQNGIINRPDRRHAQGAWHRDLAHQGWTASRPVAVSALVCLEDFTAQTGGTVFLPGGQRLDPAPPPAVADRLAVQAEAPAGSVLLFDAMTPHRAGENRSDRVRRAVNHVVGAPVFAQAVDIPAMLDRPPPAERTLADYLGYRWNPIPDVAAWRRRKVERAAAKR